MKISIGMNLHSGPFGGGNQAITALTKYLRNKGTEVFHHLKEPDLDLILLTDPRSNLKSCAYTDRDILKYLIHSNNKAIVVHRVNECDERKGTKDVNQRLISANQCADHTVFVSNWLKDLFLGQNIPCQSFSIIPNGSDRHIFNDQGYQRWNKKEKLRLVTHHWGNNWLKGFDIYQRLDTLLDEDFYGSHFSFTYIGNLPEHFQFKNAVYIKPLHCQALADEIRKHHVYLTASQNEPGGNHQNEGVNCGLPLLYRESGCLPEYCNGFGLSFTTEDFELKLRDIMYTYDFWADRMKDYPQTAEKMCANYYTLFLNLMERRQEILKGRKKWSLLHLLIKRYLYDYIR